ncbi:MAG: hypothetical protein M3R61_11970 [Chloroflexota bacterium]|nr:hypothetical protein [Chloroflexota bacterium]
MEASAKLVTQILGCNRIGGPATHIKENGQYGKDRIRAAWSYINHKDNAAKYDADEVRQIKGRIKRAAKKHSVEID